MLPGGCLCGATAIKAALGFGGSNGDDVCVKLCPVEPASSTTAIIPNDLQTNKSLCLIERLRQPRPSMTLWLRNSHIKVQLSPCSLKWLQQCLYNNYLSTTHSKFTKMSERKIWKAEEDLILKELYEQQGVKKWSEISKRMEKDYGIEGRNGKQCRERYHNHLKGGINKLKWSPEEEQQLVDLHAEHGNRWALISKLIPGRTENCVKNMLYSKLRKSIRQLNRFAYQHYRKQLKEIKISFIYRLIEFTENSYRKVPEDRNPQENTALQIKNAILRMNYDQNMPLTPDNKETIRKLMEDIHLFKRTNQRFRGSHQSKYGRRRDCKPAKEQRDNQSDLEEACNDQDSIMDEESHKMNGSLPDRSCIDTRETMKDLLETTKELPEAPAPCKMRSKVSTLRMDSLDSNLSLLLVDRGLEDPILLDNPFFTLTPTPTYTPCEDWTSVLSNWRPMCSD